MCDPFSLLFTGLSVAGKLFGGMAASKSHKQSAQLAMANTELLQKQSEIAALGADIAVTRGNYDEFLTRKKGAHTLAAETTHYASGNVDPTYGSPLAIQAYTAAQIETDAQLIRARMMSDRADAYTRVANIEGQRVQQAFKATSEEAAADTSLWGGIIGAGTAFLGGASRWPGLGGSASSTSTSPYSLFGQSGGTTFGNDFQMWSY